MRVSPPHLRPLPAPPHVTPWEPGPQRLRVGAAEKHAYWRPGSWVVGRAHLVLGVRETKLGVGAVPDPGAPGRRLGALTRTM